MLQTRQRGRSVGPLTMPVPNMRSGAPDGVVTATKGLEGLRIPLTTSSILSGQMTGFLISCPTGESA